MGKDRNEDGRFTQQHTDEDVLAAVRAHEPAGTSEVADELGIARQSADYRLRNLRDKGRVNSKKIAASLVWFAASDETTEGRPGEREPLEAPSEPPVDVSPTETPAAGESVSVDLEAIVDDVGADALPGSGEKLEARREALQAVVNYLRERGEASPADFKRDVYPDYDGQYTDGKDPARSWWKNAMYKGLRAVAEETDAIEKADTTGEWRFVGGADA